MIARAQRRAGLLAWGAVGVTITMWGGYLVLARSMARQDLGPQDLGLVRYLPAALLFAPVWMRFGLKPRRIAWRHAVAVGFLGGAGFMTLLAAGLAIAPVADAGVFTPSMLPLFVAALSALLLGERFTGLRLVGFALILVGALAVGGWEAIAQAGEGTWRGHLMLLAASAVWASYTVAYRLSKLSALEAAAMIALWASLFFGAWALVAGTRLPALAPATLALQALAQGVLTGFVAAFTYGYALTAIGPSRTAAFAALVPVIAALGGLIFLGEPIGPAKGIGIALTACGVALASGAARRRASPPPPGPV
ncbi:MAG: DMT family transporter [Alphaproteobacteria bacterium]|nr:MAG: DMT family transporter [Alphaproteobacteria bacterium]